MTDPHAVQIHWRSIATLASDYKPAKNTAGEVSKMQNKKIILSMVFIGMVINASNYIESILIPAIAKDFGLEIQQAGIIATAYLVCFGVSTVFAGPLADRYGKMEIIIISAALFTVFGFISSLSGGFLSLIIFRALCGIFAASIFPVSNALISDFFSAGERQWALGVFQSVSMIGQFLCLAVLGLTMTFFSWRTGYVILALSALFSTLMLIPIKKRAISSKNREQSFLANYLLILKESRNRQTYLIILIQGGLIFGLLSYLGAYLKSVIGLEFYITGLIISGFGVANFVFSSLGNKLAMKMGQQGAIAAGLFFGALANGLLYFWGKSLLALVMVPILLGLTFIFSHVSLLSMASEFSSKARSSSLSLVAGCFISGGGLGVYTGGLVIGRLGYDAFFAIYGLVFAVLIILVLGCLKLPYFDRSRPT